jgi:SOS response regulatory protein OraA/RecX
MKKAETEKDTNPGRKPGKQKTLYGRYDTYALPENGQEEDADLFCGGAGVTSTGEPLRSWRLVDPDRPPMSRPRAAGTLVERMPEGRTSEGRTPVAGTPMAGNARPTAVRKPKTSVRPIQWAGDTEITDIQTALSGESLLVTLEGRTADGRHLRQIIPLTVEQYVGMGLSVGRIPVEEAVRLEEAGQLCRAIRKGMELLGYGDLSVRRMVWKLTAWGAGRESAAGAAAYLKEKGFLREESAAGRRAEQGARKLWGPRRIRQDLMAQGYGEAAIRDAMESLSDPENPEAPDFMANCAALIRKKYGGVPADRPGRQRMTAGLIRLGYTGEQIREAIQMVLEEDVS